MASRYPNQKLSSAEKIKFIMAGNSTLESCKPDKLPDMSYPDFDGKAVTFGSKIFIMCSCNRSTDHGDTIGTTLLEKNNRARIREPTERGIQLKLRF